MRRILALGLLVTALAAPVAAFGEHDRPTFELHAVPAESASEPTLGIPWDTDHVFFQSVAKTYRAAFDETGKPTWTDVTPPYQVPINLDPMLWADPDTNRIHAGGLHGPCSVMMYSDDDGATWLPTLNMCSGPNLDHQSVSSGPAAGDIPTLPTADHIYYYCGQGGTISCARSLDGGVTFLPFVDAEGPCGGFHGHLRVSRVTGRVANPVGDCGDVHGFITSTDGGLSWQSVVIPGTDKWTNGFDPALQFTRDSGWMYYAMASEHGIHVALTKDEGTSWETLGTSHGAGTKWFDIGALHDPPIVAGAFTNVEAGDDLRAAVSFFGIEAGPGADLDFLNSNAIYNCDERQDELVWNYYVAFTYDGGQTWSITKASEDPVQVGGLYDVVVSGSGDCRNLLDFQDMQIDSTGRVYLGFGDGCTGACAASASPGGAGYRSDVPFVFRQITGRGLFAEHDLPAPSLDVDGDGIPNSEDPDVDGDGTVNAEDPDADGDGTPNGEDADQDADGIDDAVDDQTALPPGTSTTESKGSPGFGLVALLGAVAAVMVLRRQRTA